jgi:Spy/CpxP family protein refolding chaperone
MSSRLTQVLLGLSLLLNCFVLAGFVYRTWIAEPERAGPPPPRGRGGPIEMLMHDLKINADQRKALQGTIDKYGEHRRDRFRELQKLREAMAVELQKPQLDMAKIGPLVDQTQQLRGELFKENMAVIADMTPQLTEEQRTELHKIMAERFGGPWRGRPGDRPGEPRPGDRDRR